MLTATDGRGHRLSLPTPPQRIVSLVPSTTETLFALGCGDRVVGLTRVCVHPADRVAGRIKVGGTKDLDEARLRGLAPDLVFGNVEENTPEIFSTVEAICPLHAAFPRTVDDALEDLLAVGALTDTRAAAAEHHARIVAARPAAATRRPFTYAYLIWRRPWMASSSETFIASMLAEFGGRNVFADRQPRYFELSAGELSAAAPDVVLLSSEPFPFKDRHRDELAAESGLPADRFALVDGEYCSWHGVRMAAGLDYLAQQPWTKHTAKHAAR
jgi:iron complex transport system substrate-binding protein